MPGATVELAGGVTVGEFKMGKPDGRVGVLSVEAVPFKGFPTAISQR
jgi:hypothetical protein